MSHDLLKKGYKQSFKSNIVLRNRFLNWMVLHPYPQYIWITGRKVSTFFSGRLKSVPLKRSVHYQGTNSFCIQIEDYYIGLHSGSMFFSQTFFSALLITLLHFFLLSPDADIHLAGFGRYDGISDSAHYATYSLMDSVSDYWTR